MSRLKVVMPGNDAVRLSTVRSDYRCMVGALVEMAANSWSA